MAMKINIFNSDAKKIVDKKFITSLVKKVLKREGYELAILNIIITDSKSLKRLNKIFLKRNRSTSVISFNMGGVSEIYVSREKAKSDTELYFYIIHGLLHIVGYDHQNQRENTMMENECFEYLADA